jgi:hypothetical protein
MAMPSVASNPKEEIERPSYFGTGGRGGGGPHGTLPPVFGGLRCIVGESLTATSISVTGERHDAHFPPVFLPPPPPEPGTVAESCKPETGSLPQPLRRNSRPEVVREGYRSS